MPKDSLSFIEDHEVEEAKKLIDEQFVQLTGKPFEYRVGGPYILCKLYIRPDEIKTITADDGTKTTLWMPPQSTEMDKYNSVSGLVCGIGPDAYSGYDDAGHPRFPNGPRCRIGDWVNVPRNNAFLFQFRGVAVAQLYDDMVLGTVPDPRDLTPINQKPLF